MFQAPLVMLRGKVGKSCAQEDLIGTFTTYFWSVLHLALFYEICCVQEMCLYFHEDFVGSVQVVRLVRLAHSLSEFFWGRVAGPNYKLKLMKHHSLKAYKVKIKQRKRLVNILKKYLRTEWKRLLPEKWDQVTGVYDIHLVPDIYFAL